MSTILKALKKLEQEKEAQHPSRPTPVFSSPDTTAGEDGGLLRNPWIKGSALGVVILLLGLSAAYHYGRSRLDESRSGIRTGGSIEIGSGRVSPNRIRPDTSSGDRQTAKRRPVRDAAEKPGIVGQRRVQGTAGRPSKNSIAPEADSHISPAAMPQESNEGELSDQPQPVPVATPGKNVPDAVGPDRLRGSSAPVNGAADLRKPQVADQKTPSASSPANRAASDPSQKTPENAYANTSRLTDGRLKVHAIAWSAEAEERMAVINSRVVHEGDNVEGFLIVAIRPEDVVVREKGNGMFRVVFGHP